MEEVLPLCNVCKDVLRPCNFCKRGNYCNDAHTCQFCGRDPRKPSCNVCCKQDVVFVECSYCERPICLDTCSCECSQDGRHLICKDKHICSFKDCTNRLCSATESKQLQPLLGIEHVKYCDEHRLGIVKRFKSVLKEKEEAY